MTYFFVFWFGVLVGAGSLWGCALYIVWRHDRMEADE